MKLLEEKEEKNQETYITKRPTVEAAENILGKKFPVLDYGFVRLVDYMGNDSAVVQAARVSYGKGTKKVSEDEALIRYLMRHLHWSPFEMVELKWHIKLPIYVARQWIRHRTANVNEVSGRYSEMPKEMHIPRLDEIRFQSITNRQGSSEVKVPDEIAEKVIEGLRMHNEDSYNLYMDMLKKNIAREQSRIVLPLNLYTEWYWKNDLHNTFHFLRLRLDEHAQYEIRLYAQEMAKIMKKLVPVSYKAFEDYVLNAYNLSAIEAEIVADMVLQVRDNEKKGIQNLEDIISYYAQRITNSFERNEFKQKMRKMLNIKING